MTYIIEDSSHALVKTINNLSAVQRPDGGLTTNARVDEQLHDEDGNEYFIRRVETVVVGEGPRNLGQSAPSFKDGRWIVEHKKAAAKPPPPDPQPGADNYDFAELRRRAYGGLEQLDMIYWDEKNGTSVFSDHVSAIKEKYPKPGVEATDDVITDDVITDE